jgi:tetratricopeptide (TPR) repeat protein
MSFRFKITKSHVSSINLNQFWWPWAIISLVVTLVYFPAFTGKFILDDNSLIKNNPYIRELRPITSYLAQEDGITDRRDAGSYHTGYYRPLINVTYWLDYKLWGMTASGFRTTNLILHLLSCLLLFKVLTSLVDDRHACLFATVLFALHPVNTESVSWIVSRNNILVTLFSLFALYFYIRSVRNDSPKAMALSLLCFGCALFSKEFGLMVLPILFLYQRSPANERPSISKELANYVLFIGMTFVYLVLRQTATSSLLPPSEMGNIWSRVYFFPYLMLVNLRLILVPYGLHSFAIDYPDSYFGWEAIAGFLACILFGLFIWRERREKLVGFSLLSFLVSIVPILNIIPTSAVTLISMRWLYFPMAFFSIAITRFIQRFMQLNRFLALACVGLVLLYFGVYSYLLNKNLWHDEDTFFTREVKEFNNYLYAGALAESLLDKKRYDEAEEYFCLAIKHYPSEVKNHINYSALLIETDRAEKALSFLNKARSLTMTHNERGQWLNNMGMAYFKLGNDAEALKSFRKAILFCPNEPEFWANLGAVYGYLGDYENSVLVLKKALQIAPDSISLRKNLAVTYLRAGNPAVAVSILETIPLSQRTEMDVIQLVNEGRRILKLNERTD